jgi:long-subunit acyl-CoA synthetase (AMP-forming)
VGDAVLARPTMTVFPPAVLDKLYNAITNKFTNAEGLGGTIIYNYERYNYERYNYERYNLSGL